MGQNFCVKCGHECHKKNRICGKCGNIREVEHKNTMGSRFKENKITNLLKFVDKSLEKESGLRLRIVSRKSKLKKILEIKSNGSGNINLEANKQKIKLKETTFRLIIQEEINNLFDQLQKDLIALDEFNKIYEEIK